MGRNGVVLLKCDFGNSAIGELLSIKNLISRLLTNAVIVKNSGPLLFIECIFCFTEWIKFGVQSSSPALLASPSAKWFTFLFARQHLAKWPILPHFAHFFPLSGHSFCRDQFGATQRLQSFFLTLPVFSVVLL